MRTFHHSPSWTWLWSNKVKVGPPIRGYGQDGPQCGQLPRSALLQGAGREGLIDFIVCAHSFATPAAGHTQWADCAWGCQMTAARGCPSEPRHVIAEQIMHTRKKTAESTLGSTPLQKKEGIKRRACPHRSEMLFARNFWKGLEWIFANVDMAGANVVDWSHWFTLIKSM